MKSLDIVRNKVKKYTFFSTEPKYFIEDLNEEELNKIKQDLEVLNELKKCVFFWYDIEKGLYQIEINVSRYDNLELFNKVGQWLEEE